MTSRFIKVDPSYADSPSSLGTIRRPMSNGRQSIFVGGGTGDEWSGRGVLIGADGRSSGLQKRDPDGAGRPDIASGEAAYRLRKMLSNS